MMGSIARRAIRALAATSMTVVAYATAVQFASATVVLPLTLAETVRQADTIVVGTVVDKQSRWGDLSRRWMVTDYTVALEEVVYGPESGAIISKSIVVTYWGGSINGESQGIS